jgi:hypothetical protein
MRPTSVTILFLDTTLGSCDMEHAGGSLLRVVI